MFALKGRYPIVVVCISDSKITSPGKHLRLLALILSGVFALTLRGISQTNSWIGPAVGSWNTATNWSLGVVPIADHDVFLPDGSAATTITVSVAAVCNSLTIEGGDQDFSLVITGSNSLTVTGEITINAGLETGSAGDDKVISLGSATLTCGSLTMASTTNDVIESKITVTTGAVHVTGNITMNSPGPRNAISFSSAGTLYIGGSISGGNIIASTGTVNYNGNSAQSIPSYSYFNLTLSGSGEKTLGGNRTLTGNLLVATGTTVTLNGYNLTIDAAVDRSATINGQLNINGDGRLLELQGGIKTLAIGTEGGLFVNDNGGSTLPAYDIYNFNTTSTVEYGATDAQTIENSASYGNLIVSGGNTKTLEGAGGSMVVQGDLTIESSTTLDGNNKTLNLKGHWTNHGSFLEGTGTVVFNGSILQTIGGMSTTTFYNLTTNNSGSGVFLANDMVISSVLTLTDGIFQTGGYIVEMTQSAPGSVVGGSTASFVTGTFRHAIASGINAYDFPMGSGTSSYAPMNISFTSGTLAGILTCTTSGSDHPDIGGSILYEDGSVNRYWSFTINSGLSTANYDATFNWETSNEDAGFDALTSTVGKYDGAAWSYPAIGSRSATSVEIMEVSGFSDFQVSSCTTALISDQPAPVVVCENASASFEVIASGPDALYYQWYKTGSGMLSNGGNISGASSNELLIDPVSGSDPGNYYVMISRECGTAVLSDEVTLTVLNEIDYGTLANGNETLCAEGDPANISLSNAPNGGTGSFVYQWYYQDGIISCPSGSSTSGWTMINMATNASYNPPSGLIGSRTYALQVDATGNPDCGVAMWSNTCRQVTINQISAGEISSDQTVCYNGDPEAFVVYLTATGSGTLTYQWQEGTSDCVIGFTDITGATNAGYDPPGGLIITTYFRRIVTSTLNAIPCAAISNCITVNVLDEVDYGATATGDETICPEGDPSNILLSSLPTGGTGNFSYQWYYQDDIVSCPTGSSTIGWSPVNLATNASYNPPTGLSVSRTYALQVDASGSPDCGEAIWVEGCRQVTVNQVNAGTILDDQVICSGGDPQEITESVAAAGSGTITYQWQSSTTDCLNSFSDISGATSPTYDFPSGLTVTTYIRRIVTSTLNDVECSAISNCIAIVVNDVSSGTIGNNQTICSGGDPESIVTTIPSSGSGVLTYQWQSSITDCVTGFTDISGATQDTYNPPAGLTETTYFRRVAMSSLDEEECTATSNCIKILVNDLTPGTISVDETICFNGDPAAFNVITLATGSGILTYQWQKSTTDCNSDYSNISGATNDTYNPPPSLSETTYYRRIVTSTLNEVQCSASGNCVAVTVNEVDGGVISDDQTICAEGDPDNLTVLITATGSGTLTYQWQSSTTDCMTGFSDIPGATNALYNPPAGLFVTTYYRRRTTSTLNDVQCAAISNCVTVTINDVSSGSVAGIQTICLDGDASVITVSTGAVGSGALTYQWQKSEISCNDGFTDIDGATNDSYDPPEGLTASTHYRRIVTSTLNEVPCTAVSNCITMTINNVTGGSLNADQIICNGDDPDGFTVSVAAAGSGTITYQWQNSSTGCAIDFIDIIGATDELYDPMPGLTDTRYYRRIVTSLLNSVSCSAMSNCLTVTVLPVLNDGVVADGDESICSGGDPAVIVFDIFPTGGTENFSYQWYYQNGLAGCPTGSITAGWISIGGATDSNYNPPPGLTTSRTYAVQVDPIGNPDCGGAIWAEGCRHETVYGTTIVSGSVDSPDITTQCEGGNPEAFSVGNPTGGDNNYTYQWEQSENCSETWINAIAEDGITNTLNFDPPVLNLPVSSLCYRLKITDGCASVGYSATKSFQIVADPVSPTINPVPATETTICLGTTVSATFNAGSGGTGVITEEYEYSTNGGGTWLFYLPGDPIIATLEMVGVNMIRIRTRRTATGTGCDDDEYNIVQWSVDHIAPDITNCPVSRNLTGCAVNIVDGPVFSEEPALSSYAEYANEINLGEAEDNCGITLVSYQDVSSGTCPIVVTRTWTLQDAAGNTNFCSQTITISVPEITIVCAEDHTEAACQTQEVIDADFASWLETTVASGGCNGILTHNGTSAPPACGGSTSVTWTYTSSCEPLTTMCTKTFTVESAQVVELVCATDQIEGPCQTQEAIDVAFALWLETTNASGGCNGILTHDATSAPDACGGNMSVTWTYTSSCAPLTTTCTRSFTVESAPDITFICASAQTEEVCQTQEAIDVAFALWLETANASGGCNAVLSHDATVAPDACGGSTSVTWTYASSCAPFTTVCTKTFTVEPAPEITFNCVIDQSEESCQAQEDIDAAFALWLETTAASGGCNGVLTNDATSAPDACGGSAVVTWTYASSCAPFTTTCTRTFTVESSPEITFNCGTDQTEETCQAQEDIDAAFVLWLETTTTNGGCNGVLTNDATSAPDACGGSAVVTWTYASSCAPFTTTCTRTFTVESSPEIEFICGTDQTEEACQTQESLDDAFALWLETTTASGGCNGELTNDATSAPDACGGSTVVTWTYASSCAPYTTTCARTFTVEFSPEIAFICGTDQTEEACQTQEAIDAALALWLETTTAGGGCNGVLTNDATTAPDACGGSVIVTWTYASNCAPVTTCTKAFTVESSPEITFVCAADQTEEACQTQEAIDAVFALWLETTIASGGCDGILTHNGTSAPPACGGSTNVTWTHTSSCAPFTTTCTKTFTVDSAPVVEVVCATDQTEEPCQTQEAIDAAFALWLETTTTSGGCNGVLTNDAMTAPDACGGSTSVTWMYVSNCAPFTTTCTRTFSVESAPETAIICGTDQTEEACQTQEEIDAAFALWLETTNASGGCNAVLSNDATVAPAACGGSTSVTWTYSSSCIPFTTTCTRTFSVEPAPEITFVCATDQIEESCQTQEEIDAAFTLWLETTTAGGGCNGLLTHDATVAPDACGGTTSVTWTYTSSCAPFITTCTRTFSVESSPEITFVCGTDQTEEACQTQEEIDAAFTLWLETTTAGGGCNGILTHDATTAPDACGGTTSVTWTYTSSCAPFITTCTRTFSVESSPEITFVCGTDQTEEACQSQEQIDAAFALWLETTTVSGGCNGVLSHNGTVATAACGGSTNVTWTYTSSCEPFITTCTRTFTVESAPEISFICAIDHSEVSCQTQESIDAAFVLWLETTTASGGCNGVLSYNGTVAPAACGGSTNVTWTYTSSCAPFITTCTRTFTVESAPEIAFMCGTDQIEESCQTQEAIDAAFALWLEITTASGGCNGVLSHNGTIAPSVCGGSTNVTWTYTSSCAPFITTCTRTFTVESPLEVSFICATDQIEESCQTQEAIDAAFALWLETTTASNGCNGVLSNDGTIAPDACGGSTNVTWTYSSSCAPFTTTCTRTFTAESAPEITIICGTDQIEEACQTQEAIDAAFSLWLEITSASGGCNGVFSNDATIAPDACGGSTSVTWTYTSSCAPFITTCTRTFTVESPPEVSFICATDQTEEACQTQEAIDAAFALWLETTAASGGCNGVLTNDATSAPDACGGSAVVTWTYASSCAPFTTTCTRTFTVESAPEVVFICGTDQTEESCQTQEAIDAAFTLWLETTTASGGCNGILSNDATIAPDACGGSTTVMWTYTSSCAPFTMTCTHTFIVEAGPEVSFICAVDQTEDACQSQEEINSAFALWLETASANGGCNGVLSHDATTAPPACGGSALVTWTYNSSCTPFITTCSKTFTVTTSEVEMICAENRSETACQTQGAIDTAFASWLETTAASGGCEGVLTHNATNAPPACGGSTSVTWVYTSSCAPFSTQCTRIFSVESAPEIMFICGDDITISACTNQETIDDAFTTWLESTTASGGCNGVMTHNATSAPPGCGGSRTVTWTYTSTCAPFITQCMRTFTVEMAPALMFSCGSHTTVPPCQTQESINAQFNLWLQTTTAGGGCNGLLTHDATTAPDACGGNKTITWIYESDCSPFNPECTRTFSVTPAPSIIFICAGDQVVDACQTQSAVDSAFAVWLETTTASGGCNGLLTNNATIAPPACGGNTSVTWTYTTSCAPFITTCTKTFTVVSRPEVVFSCVPDQTEDACQTQGAIDTAFILWLEATSASGGCNGVLTNNATVAPDACGGSMSVTWTYTSSCAPFTTTCTRIFTVESAPEIALVCATDQIEEACQTQEAINAAFAVWLETTTVSGGCNGVLTNDATLAPDACGGSISVTWTYASSCVPFTTTCTKTFTVEQVPEIELMCGTNQTEDACQTQEAIDAAFTLWLESTTASGGCNGILTNNATTAPDACGGSTLVTWTYTSSCAPFVTTCTRTFTVEAAPDVEFVCASNETEDACQTQEAIDAAFALWLETTTAIGGCNGVLMHDATTAPDACGGSKTVTWTYTSSCAPFVTTCTKSFTVESAPEIAFVCGMDQTEDACQTQGAVDAAFTLWLETTTASGGCNGVLTHDATIAPDACGGSATVTWTYASSCAPFTTTCTRTFTVESAPEIDFVCSMDQIEESCQTQEAIDAAFALWLETTTAIGGCNGVLMHDGTVAPDACGGSTNVTWTYTSSCAPLVTTCTRTFTVEPAPEIAFICAIDQTEEPCQTQEAIDAAFALWLETTTASGGCNGILTHNATSAPPSCGGNTVVTWTYTSSCVPFITTCTKGFTVEAVPEVTFICATDQTEEACQTQEAIDGAFALWLETTTSSGGCNGVLSNNATPAPNACGGSRIVTWTYTSSCAPFVTTCTRTFMVESAPELVFLCAVNQTEEACQTQEAINTAFALWLETTIASGGCNGILLNDATSAPDACGGSKTVTWTYISSCAPFITTCERTFSVDSASEITLICGTDQTEESCQTQEAIDAAFMLWLETTTASGGCNGVLTHDATIAPDACGGSTSVTWTYASLCAPFITTCTRSFSIESATEGMINCAENQTEPACQTQEAIDAAFSLWLESTTASGGCNGVLTNDATTAPSACGGSTSVTWTYTSSCAPFTITCTRTFTVSSPAAITLSCATNHTEDACQTQDAIDSAFTVWLESTTASGGCNGVLTHDATDVPPACGGSTTVTWSYTSSCVPFSTTCTRTFTVLPAPDAEIICADDHTEAACQAQSAIDAAFDLWLMSTTAVGGCNGSLSHNATEAPPACGGSTTVTWTYESDCEPFSTQCSRIFTVTAHENLIIACPDNVVVPACTSQGMIDLSFQTWIQELEESVAGGCGLLISYFMNGEEIELTDPEVPDMCTGGFVTVTVNYSNMCESGSCTSTFSVQEATEVELNCPEDVMIASCSSQGEIDDAFASWIQALENSISGGCELEITYMVNGDAATDLNTISPPDFCDGGDITVVCNYNDMCGSGSCESTFTVQPDGSPSLSNAPSNQSYNTLPSGCQRGIPILKPGIDDACDADPELSIACDNPDVYFFDFGILWQADFPVGVTTITITGTDACGHQVEHVFTITINDIYIPTITGCPSGIVRSNESGQCGAHVFWTAPTASDNCPGVMFVSSHTPGDLFPAGVTTVTYTATDASGLTNTCAFTVTVNDTLDPVFNCSTLQTINLVAFAPGCTNDTNIPVPVGQDNCDGMILAAGVRSDGAQLNNPWIAGTTTTVTWSFIDDANNTTTCTQQVVVATCLWPSIYVYVDASKTSGGQTGLNWANALLRVQDALALAVTYPNIEEIWVAGDVYYPTQGTNRSSSFVLVSDVKLIGGFAGVVENISDRDVEANPTRLNGNIGNTSTNTDNCYHVVTAGTSVQNAVIDGFIIRNANANGSMGLQNVGGGLLIEGGVQLINCDIINNIASNTGSAIYITGSNAEMQIRDCIIMSNTSGNGKHVVIMNNAQFMLQGMNQIDN